MDNKEHQKLGEILVKNKSINPKDLNKILELQKSDPENRKIGELLTDMQLIKDEELLKGLSKQSKIPIVDIYGVGVDWDIIERFPISLLKQANALPISHNELEITFAVSDPYSEALEQLERQIGERIMLLRLAPKREIEHFLKRIEMRYEIKKVLNKVKRDIQEKGEELQYTQESAVLQLIRLIIKKSIFNNASDIHIEPSIKEALIRIRVDGILHVIHNFDLDIYQVLVTRIKILGNLDISEHRKAQDGRFSLSIDKHPYDFRLSVIPTLYGESVVMRILDRQKVLLKLRELGFNKNVREHFENAIKQPYGIILITGPTGSGKTSTLYAALNEIKSTENKIITIEDPIEYHLPLIQQVQVNEKVEYGFSEAVRSFLRHDPDVIMIGEIRDTKTLETATQAALTGHLVMSTLHTNDAPGAINRMVQMGLAPYLLADAILAIVAQRLVRKICPYCKEETNDITNMPPKIAKILPKNSKLYRGKGCAHCEMTGYLGRTVIAEILSFDENIAEAVSDGARKGVIIKEALKRGLYRPMVYDGVLKIIKGITTIDEVIRVTRN